MKASELRKRRHYAVKNTENGVFLINEQIYRGKNKDGMHMFEDIGNPGSGYLLSSVRHVEPMTGKLRARMNALAAKFLRRDVK